MAMMGLASIGQIDRYLLESLGPPGGGANPFPLLPEHVRY
jgi:hypothetical protein